MGQGQVPEPGLWKKTKIPIKTKEIQKSFKLFYSNQFSGYHSLQLIKRDCVLYTAEGKHELHPSFTHTKSYRDQGSYFPA